jgi:hypothetical protein
MRFRYLFLANISQKYILNQYQTSPKARVCVRVYKHPLQSAFIFEPMAMNKTLKGLLTVGGLFVALRVYKLWQLFNGIQYSFKHLRFSRPTSNLATNYHMTITYRIFNPTPTAMQISNMYGTVSVQDTQIAGYSTGPFVIKPGEQTLDVKVALNPTFVLQTLFPMLAKRQFPIFDTTMTVRLPIGLTHTERFSIATKDYLPSDLATLIQGRTYDQTVFK